MTVTPEQLHILQHSLGVDEYGQGNQYRNHYVAPLATALSEVFQELVKLGLMKNHGSDRELTGGGCLLTVTPEGKRYVAENSPKPPKISKAKQRYREWLQVADCFPDFEFGDWLKWSANKAKEARGVA